MIPSRIRLEIVLTGKTQTKTSIATENSLLKFAIHLNVFLLITYNSKHFDGKFTYYKGIKKSQNDIVLGDPKALDNIEKFVIHEISFNPSDHFPVVTCKFPLRVKDFMSKAAADLLTNAGELNLKRAKKILSLNVVWDSYNIVEKLGCCKIQSLSLIIYQRKNYCAVA